MRYIKMHCFFKMGIILLLSSNFIPIYGNTKFDFEYEILEVNNLKVGECIRKALGTLDLGSGSFKAEAGVFEFCYEKPSKVINIFETESKFRAATKIDEFNIFSKNIKESMIETIRVLMTTLEKKIKTSDITWRGFATAIFRKAENGKETINEISKKINTKIVIISQEEEGLSRFLSFNKKPIWDTGGASSQIMWGEEMILINFGSTNFNQALLKKLSKNENNFYPLNSIPDFDFDIPQQKSDFPKSFIVAGGLFEKTIFGKICLKDCIDCPIGCNKNTVSIENIEKMLKTMLHKSKHELNEIYPEDTAFVDSYVTDFIFAYLIMKKLNIKKVTYRPFHALNAIYPDIRNLELNPTKLDLIKAKDCKINFSGETTCL